MARKPGSSAAKASLKGDLVLLDGGEQSLTGAQVLLLKAIDQCGSITAAAKQVGVSYKTAWDRIDAMNNLADQALVARSTGGRKGGGTRLTEQGRNIIAGFEALQQEHAEFVAGLDDRVQAAGDVANFLRSSSLRSSARNQYRGRVSRISRGGVNAEVSVRLSDSVTLVAIITNDSRQQMGLKKGSEVIALEIPDLLTTDTGIKIPNHHRHGQQDYQGEGNSEVILDLDETGRPIQRPNSDWERVTPARCSASSDAHAQARCGG
ncbi:MAG: TOBE domain-containing protein [Pseudohongiellaceae bacterium]